MVLEDLILVALLDGVLLLQAFDFRLLLRFGVGVPLREPARKIERFVRDEACMDAMEDLEGDAAVCTLLTRSFDEVDGRVADKIGGKEIGRAVVDLERCVVLLEDTVVDEADLRREGHRFHLIMGDIDEGRAGLQVETLQLVAHLETKLRIEVTERLIHEEHLWLRCEGTGDGNTLLLTAGKLCRITIHEHTDLYDTGNLTYTAVDLFVR